jgi:predicted N-acetyltransferase YhbS
MKWNCAPHRATDADAKWFLIKRVAGGRRPKREKQGVGAIFSALIWAALDRFHVSGHATATIAAVRHDAGAALS